MYMENWRCKNLVFPKQTRNMAPIVGGTFKTLLYTHAHTHTHIHHQSSYPFDFGLSSHKWFKPLECFGALEPFLWLIESVVFWHANSDIHMHHKARGTNMVCLYLENESYSSIPWGREGGRGGVPRGGGDVWCVLSNNVGYLPFFHMIVWST